MDVACRDLHEGARIAIATGAPPSDRRKRDEPGDVVVDPLRPLTPEEVEAVARRLAARLLAGRGTGF